MSDCDCITWGRDNAGAILWLSHHPNCVKYKPEQEIRDLLLSLIDGIEEWARDEDGVHPECWEAYQRACAVVGKVTRIKEEE